MQPLTAHITMQDGSRFDLPFDGDPRNAREAVSYLVREGVGMSFNGTNVMLFPGCARHVRVSERAAPEPPRAA